MLRWFGVLLLLLGACSGQQAYAPGPGTAASAAAAAGQPASGEYALGTSDKVRVTVFNEPTLSGEFVVSPNGTLSLPLVGDVQAKGMTASQIDTAIEKSLAAGYLRDPKVTVEVLTYRPFYVLGEVNHAGEYPYSDRMTVLQAIAAAQGFTYRAEKNRVFVKRAGQDVEESVPLTSTLTVGPGDTIRVGERYF